MSNRLAAAVLALAMAAGFVATPPPAVAEVYVRVAPPAVRYEPVPGPRRGFVWVPGHWRWTGAGYAWRPGHWRKARAGYRWAGARWAPYRGGWRYVPGGWVR